MLVRNIMLVYIEYQFVVQTVVWKPQYLLFKIYPVDHARLLMQDHY